MDPKSNDQCPLKKRHTQGEHHGLTEPETGQMPIHSKESQGLWSITKSWEEAREDASLESNLPRPWLKTSSLQNCERIHSCSVVLSQPVGGTLFWLPWETREIYSAPKCMHFAIRPPAQNEQVHTNVLTEEVTLRYCEILWDRWHFILSYSPSPESRDLGARKCRVFMELCTSHVTEGNTLQCS